MRGLVLNMAMACAVIFAPVAAQAEIDGHGPDAWRVIDVAPDDILNMRIGPGTDYIVIDQLAPNARGLKLVTCVPLLIPSVYHKLSDAQRAALPQSWCLMRSADLTKAGWVAARFLMEDIPLGSGSGAGAFASGVVETAGDALIDEAVFLVRDLYAAFETTESRSDNPFGPERAHWYFFGDLVPALGRRGADLLYDAQDFDGQFARIGPDPEQPMFRGMITVTVDYTNFGRADHVIFRLRADTEQPGSPLRIFRVEHDGWSFPR